MELDRLQHDRPAACVIAQQCPAVFFHHPRLFCVFRSYKEKFGAFKNAIISFFHF
jgi:hypothetical protein